MSDYAAHVRAVAEAQCPGLSTAAVDVRGPSIVLSGRARAGRATHCPMVRRGVHQAFLRFVAHVNAVTATKTQLRDLGLSDGDVDKLVACNAVHMRDVRRGGGCPALGGALTLRVPPGGLVLGSHSQRRAVCARHASRPRGNRAPHPAHQIQVRGGRG